MSAVLRKDPDFSAAGVNHADPAVSKTMDSGHSIELVDVVSLNRAYG
jgi:hypothetical protein